ncbi:MAG: hypothetical protein FJ290_11185 [Planctomycetes bacterium]|nr:hypothetical protein [Planctomycetota bacterium]
MPRILSPEFMADLKSGMLLPLLKCVQKDRDLILEIRDDAVNVYSKGQSLVRLARRRSQYQVAVHPKFASGVPHGGSLTTIADTQAFVERVPAMKQAISQLRVGLNEIECEQMLVRASVHEPTLNPDYLVIDRQIVGPSVSKASRGTAGKTDRPDLVGIYWPRGKRRRNQAVSLALIEMKFGCRNQDLSRLHEQLGRYYDGVAANLTAIVQDTQTVLRQKLALGLFRKPRGVLEALATLTISAHIQDVLFLIVLAELNPGSKRPNWQAINNLHFAKQVKLFRVGYALWDEYRVSEG